MHPHSELDRSCAEFLGLGLDYDPHSIRYTTLPSTRRILSQAIILLWGDLSNRSLLP
jgi:hypothetical protein